MSAIETVSCGLEDSGLVERYDRLFDCVDGAYVQQSTAWARAINDLGPDQPIFLLARRGGDDLAGLPLYLFQAEPGNLLTSVPQPGPLGGVFARADLDAGTREVAFAALLSRAVELAREHNCITMTLITDPLTADLPLYERHLAPELIFENFTQIVPLGQIFHGEEIILPRYRRSGSFRQRLRRAMAYGFTLRAAASEADVARWYEVHVKRHGEVGATPLPRALLERLLHVLEPSGRARLWLVEKDGVIVGGGLFVWHRATMDVFIMSMDSTYAAEAPGYALVDAALRWAHGLGVERFNWQSSASRTSGVYAFKARWGAEERQYHFVTKIFALPERLAALGADGIKRHYPGHYVLPFGAFADGCRGGRYRKD
jgi:CelD/BcsL family acetyltransferase involved in cellulose biosynthesis